MRQGKQSEARKLLLQLREKFPNQSDVDIILALLYLEASDYDRAMELAEEILAQSPSKIEARLILAKALRGLSLAEQAIAQLEQIFKSQPKNIGALELMARIHEKTGQHEMARLYIEQIDSALVNVEINPGIAARIKIWKKDLKGALEICQTAIAEGRSNNLVRVCLVDIHRRRAESGQEEVHLIAFAKENKNSFTPFRALAAFYATRDNPERGSFQFQTLRLHNEVFARLA